MPHLNERAFPRGALGVSMIENFNFESQGIDPCGPRSPLMTLNDLITGKGTPPMSDRVERDPRWSRGPHGYHPGARA